MNQLHYNLIYKILDYLYDSPVHLDYNNLNIKEIESIVNERIRFSFVARNYNNSQNKNKFKCSIVKDKEEIFTQIIDNPNFEWYPDGSLK